MQHESKPGVRVHGPKPTDRAGSCTALPGPYASTHPLVRRIDSPRVPRLHCFRASLRWVELDRGVNTGHLAKVLVAYSWMSETVVSIESMLRGGSIDRTIGHGTIVDDLDGVSVYQAEWS